MDQGLVKRIGIKAACESAGVLHSHFGNLVEIKKKGSIDLVTEADVRSEKIIIEIIRSHFPDHAIMAEESGCLEGKEDFRWIIDPLDGTTNFAHGLGLFAVSIAFAFNGEVVMGVVLNPETNELFCGVKGEGATLNGKAITVTTAEKVSESLLVTGFPYNFNSIIRPLMTRFENCLSAARAVRRLGSAALDLCFVACGRFDGFWEQNLKPWDTAAGMLIALEAGALITDFSNKPFSIEGDEVLATNGKIHNEMLSLLKLKDIK